MEIESTPSTLPLLVQRLQSLVWSCIDSGLTRSALFFAERYFALNQQSHDARHLYAIALLNEGQTYSALSLVNLSREKQCSGCLELKARCSTVLGRYRQAREALDECIQDPTYSASSSQGTRPAKLFPDEAALLCRSGTMALKGNLPERASNNFKQALALNPLLWEAFEGLCVLGVVHNVDALLPPRPPPIKRTGPDDIHQQPSAVASTNFFTPATVNPTFRDWKLGVAQPQAFRKPSAPQDSPELSFFAPDNTFQQHRLTRSQPTVVSQTHAAVSRPLSSADETGPATKKLRSTSRQNDPAKSKPSLDESLKKPTAHRTLVSGKSNNVPTSSNTGTRRSSRLLTSSKHASKTSTRDRRRPPPTHARSRSIESEMDDDAIACSPSPSSIAQSPRSDRSPSPVHMNEQAAQEVYEIELVDHYIYDLMRRFANATQALSTYDSQRCRSELEQLPQIHQQTPWVLAMVGRAHYELADYPAAERAFKALRILDPYRLWDMEVYSTLLWHLQRNVELSFLAQELLNINPRSSQAWIAIGNLFSLQKERSQALTCFRRAAQMDPSCAYAFTLSGHETIDEDLDKAINFFQSALRVDARHYNAWYGLGTCYLRMSKLRLAEYHYQKAVDIHPHNAVLLGCVGMASPVAERRGDRDRALGLFDKAVRMSPENALVRYRRAKILILMKRYDQAIRDLEYLRSATPEESNVVFQLARVYRLVGDGNKAAQLLAIARDISPKSANKIKKLLETVKDEPVDDKMDEG